MFSGPGTPFGYHLSPDGFLGGVHGGYNWQFGQVVLGLDADVEGSLMGAHHSKAIPGGTGNFHDFSDFDSSIRGKLGWSFGRVMPYLTGGVAFDYVHTHFNLDGAAGGQGGIRIGPTGGGGVDYALTPNWSIAAEYRYTDLSNHNVPDAPYTGHNFFTDNVVRAVLTYRFAPPPPPPPPAPMPAAAPAPAPPPMARTFLVFFDFDRYNLRDDARRVIEAAAANYKATGSARIEVSGYTDLAGTQAYNMRLSQRRADAVAAYLMRQGVPKNVMDVKWFGKEHPRVPTPDGVREPQNRRVEIVMQ